MTYKELYELLSHGGCERIKTHIDQMKEIHSMLEVKEKIEEDIIDYEFSISFSYWDDVDIEIKRFTKDEIEDLMSSTGGPRFKLPGENKGRYHMSISKKYLKKHIQSEDRDQKINQLL